MRGCGLASTQPAGILYLFYWFGHISGCLRVVEDSINDEFFSILIMSLLLMMNGGRVVGQDSLIDLSSFAVLCFMSGGRLLGIGCF
jgi:hypothetical protein